MKTDTIETTEAAAQTVPDLSLYVRKNVLFHTARRLRVENSWCRTPLDAVAEMGVDESVLSRPKLDSLPNGSVVADTASYATYVWVKAETGVWERTHTGAFNGEGDITEASYVRAQLQDRDLPTRFNVIYRPDGRYETEIPQEETDPSKVDINDYVLKTEVLRITMRYVAANPHTTDIVVDALASLGIKVPERVQAADLPVGALVGVRDYDLGNFSALKVAENEWTVTSWDSVHRGGFLANGRYLRAAMTDVKIDTGRFVILYNPTGEYQD